MNHGYCNQRTDIAGDWDPNPYSGERRVPSEDRRSLQAVPYSSGRFVHVGVGTDDTESQRIQASHPQSPLPHRHRGAAESNWGRLVAALAEETMRGRFSSETRRHHSWRGEPLELREKWRTTLPQLKGFAY